MRGAKDAHEGIRVDTLELKESKEGIEVSEVSFFEKVVDGGVEHVGASERFPENAREHNLTQNIKTSISRNETKQNGTKAR